MSPANSTQAIVKFAYRLRYEDIPEAVLEHCKGVILDSLGCALAATTLGDDCQLAVNAITSLDTAESCSIFGTRRRSGPVNAAFLNGALIHALNFDATGDYCGHQGVVCLAAPFAAGEMLGRSGRDLLTASVVACEVAARMTAAIARTGRHPSEKFLAGQLLSYHGATAGAGHMFGLEEDAMHSALGLALMQMAGTRQIVLRGDPPAKSLYGGFPNQAAVQSCYLAMGGVDARCELFAEPAGLYSMIYNGDYLDSVLYEGLGQEYLLLEAEIKPWPCSKKLHAVIDTALALRHRSVDFSHAKRIDVLAPISLRPWSEPVMERKFPANASAAANSLQYCLAKILQNGKLSPDDFSAGARADHETLRLSDMIFVTYGGDAQDLNITVEHADGHCDVEVRVTDNSTIFGKHDQAVILNKFRDCCRFSEQPINSSDGNNLAHKILTLEKVSHLGELFSS